MKKFFTLTLAVIMLIGSQVFSQQADKAKKDGEKVKMADTRRDNNGYWKRMAALGLATLNPVTPVKPAVYTGSGIQALSVLTEDSPDVPVTSVNSTQSENSIFVNPTDNQKVLNSNNSTQNPVGNLYGANYFLSDDAGITWGGSVNGAGGSNSGDPTTAISLTGRHYVGYINNAGGQSVSYSTNGTTWTAVVAASPNGDLLDKNHMWIDNSPVSPYEGNIYVSYTDFGASGYPIEITRSNNDGVSYSTPINISSAVNAGSHSQGVNIQTGPNGEVYVVWAIYDSWPSDESSMGFARSFDGGATYEPATRIISDIRGIRTSDIGKNMRKNSFPSMAVDISGGEYNGNIYIVWSNIGVPGINSGNSADVYIIRSEDQGLTWTDPVQVNTDPTGLGKKHYFPWITCDPENGILSVVFYDDRNVSSSQCEVYCANSYDGGDTWEDFKVSDVAFTPSPIPGLADGYMGDYLGINARGGMVYPVWPDNRTGTIMTYCSPYETNPLSKPKSLIATVAFETGISDLNWQFTEAPLFSHFIIYRDGDSIAASTDTVYSDQLPDYGVYNYMVTARYTNGDESSGASASVQWGDAQISVTPEAIEESLLVDEIVTKTVTVSNIGQLPMDYTLSLFVQNSPSEDPTAYCFATGGQCDEYIARVTLNEIDNVTSCDGYVDYTELSTQMSVGNTYTLTIYNGSLEWPADQAGAWVDWNHNEEFEPNEEITLSNTPGVGPYVGQITPPVGALSGDTRLRTRIVYNQTPEPCGETSYGEVEDYTINVQSWLTVNPMSGSVPAGENMNIDVMLDATGMELGTYTADLQIYSNDPDDPEVVVPITMHVVDISVALTADDDYLCLGDVSNITSTMTGGSGTFTYTWTSDPVGFSSTEPNITVTPEVTTTYICEVFDGTVTVSDQITIQVNPLPSVDLGADAILCTGDSLVLDAGAGFAAYIWNTGDTTQTLTVDVTGEYNVVITNEFGCVDMDTTLVTFLLTVDKAVITDGSATVDNFNTPSTVYTCAEVANAASYEWVIQPAEAGTTSSTGTSAEVFWTSGFTGTAQITVTASNDCFTGEASDPYITNVYTSAGLKDHSAENQIIIFPNPTDGKIILKLAGQKEFYGDLTVSDAGGVVVILKKGYTIPAGDEVTLDLSPLSKGAYTVSLTSKTSVYTGRVIVK